MVASPIAIRGSNGRVGAPISKYRVFPRAASPHSPSCDREEIESPAEAGAGLHFGRRSRECGCDENPRRRRKTTRRFSERPTEGFPVLSLAHRPLCDECIADPQTGEAPGVTRSRNVRSRCRCSMCPAIHINSRSWLRSSSTHEPSDPPPRVVISQVFGRGRVRATDSRRTLPVRTGGMKPTRRRTSFAFETVRERKKKFRRQKKTEKATQRKAFPKKTAAHFQWDVRSLNLGPITVDDAGLSPGEDSRRLRYPRL